MCITAFIFARGGSKGVLNKNIKFFAGKPLIAWSIELCLNMKQIDRVIVSTDSEEISFISKEFGAEVPFIRPDNLSDDNSSEWLAWQHALKFIKEKENFLPKIMISIPPTSPLRESIDVENCITEYQKGNSDIVLATTKPSHNPYFNMLNKKSDGSLNLLIDGKEIIQNRQNSPKVYGITTVAYVTSPEFVLTHNSLFDNTLIRSIDVPVERSIDIDTMHDFKIAEYLMMEKIKNKNN